MIQQKLDLFPEPNTWDIEKFCLDSYQYEMYPADVEISFHLDMEEPYNFANFYFYV